MEKIELFKIDNRWLTNIDFLNVLNEIEASDADVLYIHSSLNFGIPNTNLKKKELLSALLNVILSLNINTIIFPTYTFSFCNGQDFDIQNSKTSMGILNDFVRQNNNAIRSHDPLMSNVLIGEHKEFVSNIGKNSCGENSTFDLLHKTNLKVKFLFFGAIIGDCFTYMHYIEERVKAPYRYNKLFSGNIINNGIIKKEDFNLFVRYGNVFPGPGSYIYENILIEKGIAKKVKFGNSFISLVDEKGAYDMYVKLITQYPSFFIREVFDENQKIPNIPIENMVSL